MKTQNRPTASTHPSTEELAELGHRVRLLWSAHLRATDDEREQLIVELSEVDTQIQRLGIRVQCEVFTRLDQKILTNAVARVEELEHRWQALDWPDRQRVGAAA